MSRQTASHCQGLATQIAWKFCKYNSNRYVYLYCMISRSSWMFSVCKVGARLTRQYVDDGGKQEYYDENNFFLGIH